MVVVAPASTTDVQALEAIIAEMNIHYGETDAIPHYVRLQQIHQAVFGPRSGASVLLAWNDGHLVGFAAYSFLWPAVGLTQSLFLKELYVLQSARRSGVGRSLMHGLFEIAAERQCSRVEWQTDAANSGAQAFYAKLGAHELDGKIFFRLEGQAIPRAISDTQG